LPSPWHTLDWPTLLVLCRDYYNSVKPFSFTKWDASHNNSGNGTPSGFDRLNHQKKVRQWFLNPVKFCQEIEKEQLKYPGKCIFHLSSTHPTETCNVKLECDKVRSTKTPTSNSDTKSSGQLQHITEEYFEDAVDNSDLIESVSEGTSANDTNEDGLLYFACLTYHYLCLARASSNQDHQSVRHAMPFPVIADSGAIFHMFKECAFFSHITPVAGKVLLGDGKTVLPIKGVGTVQCFVDENLVTLENVRFIPDLSESIYSLFLHIKYPGHGLQSSFESGLFVSFPNFTTKTLVGEHDIYLNMIPIGSSDHSQGGASSNISLPLLSVPEENVSRNIKLFQSDLQRETDYLDNLLEELRTYYHTVKT
jgi:hypothetical protein